MRHPVKAIAAFMLTSGTIVAAAAQPLSADCAVSAPLPSELAGWASRIAVEAATAGHALPVLKVGSAVDAALSPADQVVYFAPPEQPAAAASNGGILALMITEPATYRVALGSKAWVDVLENGKAIKSIAHGHGPRCSGIRKMVDFPLKPGSYVVQIAGSADPAIAIMVARLP